MRYIGVKKIISLKFKKKVVTITASLTPPLSRRERALPPSPSPRRVGGKLFIK